METVLMPDWRTVDYATRAGHRWTCPCGSQSRLWFCTECETISGTPGTGNCEEPACTLREASDAEMGGLNPAQECTEHGWCGGCTHSRCEDCAGCM